MLKKLKIAGAHNWKKMTENFVRRTEGADGQSVLQLRIFMARLACKSISIRSNSRISVNDFYICRVVCTPGLDPEEVMNIIHLFFIIIIIPAGMKHLR